MIFIVLLYSVLVKIDLKDKVFLTEMSPEKNPFEYDEDMSSFVDMLDIKAGPLLHDTVKLTRFAARTIIEMESSSSSLDRKLEQIIASLKERSLSGPAKKPLHILLLSTWSSGSTFLTKLLTHYPGTFLTFEPMVLIKG